jgi:hypothetical protein
VHSRAFFESVLWVRVFAQPSEVLFSLGEVSAAFCIFIVSFKETVPLGSFVQPALQFSHVKKCFPMLAETRTLEISLHFHLE